MMSNNRKLQICCLLNMFFLMSACTDNGANREIEVPEGTYRRAVCLQSDEGTISDTKGMINGIFTNVYDAPYIYLHSYDEEGEDKWVRYDFTEETTCDKGFHLNVTVEGDKYIVVGQDEHGGEKSIEFSKGDQVYFSSIQDETWKGTTSTASPINNQTVLIRDEQGPNKELYRSDNYNIEDLVTGQNGVADEIVMHRKCSAFVVYFLFTDFDFPFYGNITDVRAWEGVTGTSVDDWKGKMYLGSCFGDTYDVEFGNSTFSNGDNGYYASWGQKYTTFTEVTFNTQSIPGQTESASYSGVGIQTSNDFLITPYEINHNGEMEFYAFIKYQTTSADDSDEGAKYFQYTIKTTVPKFNTTNYYVIVCDIDDLAVFTSPSSDTRSITGPQKIDLQPIEVIHIQE